MTKRCNKKKGYVILGYNESEDKYYGYVELSFSMGASDKDVQVYSTYKETYWDKYFQEKYIDLFKKMNPNSPNQLIYFWLRDISITRKGLASENEEGEFQAGWIVSKLKGCEDCIEGEYWKDFDISYKDISDLEILPESLIGWDNVSI
jgi:hypothetical protein